MFCMLTLWDVLLTKWDVLCTNTSRCFVYRDEMDSSEESEGEEIDEFTGLTGGKAKHDLMLKSEVNHTPFTL